MCSGSVASENICFAWDVRSLYLQGSWWHLLA